MGNDMAERAIGEIRETFASLRIISPKADAAMENSLRLYGQISPVVCVSVANGIELVDGFKRLRACRSLHRSSIGTVLLDTSIRACKASIIQLNRVAKSINDLEEAMILQSLHRTDGLSQVEIATLLGRDKSWVSRRISLVERLSDEVREHLRLGLISASVGRELARLPRGNQTETLRTVLEHHLGKRDVEKMVRFLLTRPARDYAFHLNNISEILAPDSSSPAMTPAGFSKQLVALEHLQKSVSQGVAMAEADKPYALLVRTILSSRQVLAQLELLLSSKPVESI